MTIISTEFYNYENVEKQEEMYMLSICLKQYLKSSYDDLYKIHMMTRYRDWHGKVKAICMF